MGIRGMAGVEAAARVALAIALVAGAGCGSGDDDGADGAADGDDQADGGDGSDDQTDDGSEDQTDDSGDDQADDGDDDPRYSLLIRGDRFQRLVIEVDSAPGMEPDEAAIGELADLLGGVVDKPGGVDVAMDGALAAVGSDHAWTFEDLQTLADETFDLDVPDDSIAVHLLFVDGHSADDTSSGVVLGVAWSHTHIAVFQETIQNVCAASVLPELLREAQCQAAERTILTHESGHLLGLVDNGLPMVAPHRDPDHGRHDTDSGCVMYWAYDGGALFDAIGDRLLGGGEGSIGFDDACLADLAAERDR